MGIICKRNRETKGSRTKTTHNFPPYHSERLWVYHPRSFAFYGVKRRITALTPVRSKITYHKYVGFCFGRVLPCSLSVLFHKIFSFSIFVSAHFSKITYAKYVGFLKNFALSRYISLWRLYIMASLSDLSFERFFICFY